jgi:hypothetical protein
MVRDARVIGERGLSANNRFERSRGRVFGEPREWIDDLDKSASLDIDAAPRRSTSSLGAKSPMRCDLLGRRSSCGRRLSFDLRKLTVEACPAWRTRRPHRQRRTRQFGIVKRPDPYEYQVGPRFGLARKRRTTNAAKTPAHTVPAVSDAEVVSGFSGHGEAGRTKARVHGPAACTKVLAVAAPAHSSHYRQLRAFPANRTAEASTSCRHDVARLAT